MSLTESIEVIKKEVGDSTKGLPEEVFELISSLTPLVNIDIIVKDTKNSKTLLSWRSDKIHGEGWHVPGSILKFKEGINDKFKELLSRELGILEVYNVYPVCFNQIILPEANVRGHFLSLLYNCNVKDDYVIDNGDKKETDEGFLKWHYFCPENLLKVHDIYKDFINVFST